MKHAVSFTRLLLAVVCGILPATNAFSNGTPKIELVEPTIDYPASKVPNGLSVVGTRPFGINDFGNLSIQVNLSDGSTWVGTRMGGSYSVVSQPPGTSGFAQPEDINNFNVLAGYWFDGTTYLGFLLSNGSYTDFNLAVPSATFTAAIGINDLDFISGYYGTSTVLNQAFRQVSNKEFDLKVTNAVGTAASATNDLLQTAGYSSTSDPSLTLASCGCLGVVWDSRGKATTFAVKEAVSTIALGINVPGWVAGRYYDSQGNLHAFLYNLRCHKFLTYDYPGAVQTSFNGINDAGYIAARYTDALGIAYGFIARITGEFRQWAEVAGAARAARLVIDCRELGVFCYLQS
jgi:hypothetical protein